ncbi:MAG: LysR family transcriptional regulator [Pseudomonadota bacterium]
MRLENIDLNLFVVFEAMHRERNVTRVANQLNITQPAVSNILARLRDAFGDPLFVRSSEGMNPTPVADGLIGDVRKALDLMRKSIGQNTPFSPSECEKTFRLGMNDLAEFLFLPQLYKQLKSEAPMATLTSFYAARETATEDLKTGKLDLLVDAPAVNARDLQQRAVAGFPYVALMRSDHPLLAKRLTLNTYLGADHLHVSSRRTGRGHVDIALNRLGKRRGVSMRVQNYLVAEKIMAETDLIWTAPKILADALSLRWRTLPFDVEPLTWCLYWSKSADSDPANRWFREQVGTLLAN